MVSKWFLFHLNFFQSSEWISPLRDCVSIELSSLTVSRKVFSPLQSLTSVFGMGTGGPSAFITLTNFSKSIIHWILNNIIFRGRLLYSLILVNRILSSILKTTQCHLLDTLYVLHRKEVIQPHLPIRLPCYDLTPIIEPTFDDCLLAVSSSASGVFNFHGLTGGVYKARERIHRDMLIRDY